MENQNKQYKPSIFNGVILAIAIMLGVAVGAKLDNIKMGISLGLLAGTIIACILEIMRFLSFKKQR